MLGGGAVDLSAVAQDIIPSVDNTYDVGSQTSRWAEGHFAGVQIGSGAAVLADHASVGIFFRFKGTDGAPVTPRIGDFWPDVAEDATVVNVSLLAPDDSVINSPYRLGDLDRGATTAVQLAVGGTYPIYIPNGFGDEYVNVTTTFGTISVTLPENTTYTDAADLALAFATARVEASDDGGELRLETLAKGLGAFITLDLSGAPTFAASAGMVDGTVTGTAGTNASWAVGRSCAGKVRLQDRKRRRCRLRA